VSRARSGSADGAIESHHALTRLKWLTTIVPAIAVFLYETVRHELLEPLLPTAVGNLIAGLLALVLAYGFSELVFGIVEGLQADAMAHSRERAVLNATVQERERMSRELHDGLAQVVAYLLVRIDTVAGLVEANRPEEALGELERLRAAADDLYADVRDSISSLRTRITERGLLGPLEDYLGEFEERHGIRVELQADARLEKLAPPDAYQIFRIVQEALANARKHAQAHRVWVSATVPTPTKLLLTIVDDGRGFNPATAGGPESQRFGLTAMRERAVSLGGKLSIESTTGGGTRVIVTIPLATRLEDADATLATAPR